MRKIRDPESRERIVDAASRCIAEGGLKGATVRTIAREAGVSTGFVMHYFPDKAALAEAVLDRTNRGAGARVAAAASSARGRDGLAAAVDALLPLDAERRLEWRVWAAFWTAAPATGGGGGLIGARNALGRMVRRCLADAIAVGELPDGLDLDYEVERLMTLAAGLGLSTGSLPDAGVRRLARRMVDDHLARLAEPVRS